MPLIAPIYIVDASGQQWLLAITNAGILTPTPVSGAPAVPYLYLNSITDNLSYQITIVPNPPPAGLTWGQVQVQSTVQGNYPLQAMVTAPNGTIYALRVATVGPPILGSTSQGIIQVILPVTVPGCNTSISALAANVLSRLEDPAGVFWSNSFEIYTGIVEAMNDLMILVGRPTQTVNTPFNLQTNSAWQQVPRGIFCIVDIWGPQSRIRKVNLWDMDYNQSSWGSDWENDVSDIGPQRWGSLGFGNFFVHPAPSVPQTVLLDGVALPVAETNFPYLGTEVVPFHDEFFAAIEEYTAVYARIKEGSSEFQQAMPMYQSYLAMAKRMTEIESRKDDLVFSASFGAPVGLQSHVKR